MMRKLLVAAAFFAVALIPVNAQVIPVTGQTAIACAYNSSVPTPTSGQYFLVQCDSNGNLLTASAGGGGGTSSSFGSAFPATGTAIGLTDGTNMIALPGTAANGAYVQSKSGAFVDGSIATIGAQADVAYAGSGSAGLVGIGKGIYAATKAPTGAFGSAAPSTGTIEGGKATSTEPAAATTGNLVAIQADLSGKQVISPFAIRELQLRGAANATTTGAATLIAAQGASVKIYVTGLQCFRTDAGTTAVRVTLNDTASTVLGLPNNGGGGGNNVTFPVPLAVAANTALTFTASSAITTIYCNAQGFAGY